VAPPAALRSHPHAARPAADREDLRRNNLAAIVRHLHLSGPLTRSELTARTGLNRSTVGALAGELAAAGLARESTPEERSGAGRPSLVVSLETTKIWVLAIELATEALVAARVGVGGRVLEELSEPRDWRSDLTPEAAVASLARMAKQLERGAPAGSRRVGVFAAVPGIVRREDGFVHLAPNLAWREVPFGAMLSKALPGRPVIQAANEADLGALAEHTRGAGVGSRHMIYVSGNVGVGAGVIVEGALLAGRSGYAGEVGHMKLNPDGHRCRCGGRGCWESEIGAAALLRRAGRRAPDARLGMAKVLADAEQGNPRAVAAVRETALWVGRGAASLLNIFNPEILIFGGELRAVFRASESTILSELRRQALPSSVSDARLAGAGLGSDSVVLGAAEMAFAPFLANPLASALA
jgi:predicted NBD/HSP70 family sugar kinase